MMSDKRKYQRAWEQRRCRERNLRRLQEVFPHGRGRLRVTPASVAGGDLEAIDGDGSTVQRNTLAYWLREELVRQVGEVKRSGGRWPDRVYAVSEDALTSSRPPSTPRV